MSDAVMARKRIEIEKKMLALSEELKVWRRVSVAGAELEKHHSQIARLSAQLDSAVASLRKRPEANPQKTEQSILDLHYVWDFFRSKLVLRTFKHFREVLELADELAYACYKPATINAGERLKEPPLTFFSTIASPFAMPRNEKYASTLRTRNAARDTLAVELLQSLPVPVVAVPWFQLGHLPDLAIVAHEAGHHVELDLDLQIVLDAALRAKTGIDEQHRSAWIAWRGEVFADVYATRALGRAFTRALHDFLMTDADTLKTQKAAENDWGMYPTPILRLQISAAVLENAGTLTDDIKALLEPLQEHAMKSFHSDCVAVVTAMLETQIPNEARKVKDLLAFEKHNETSASTAAQAARDPSEITTRDIRELAAAVVHAYVDDPSTFAAAEPWLRKAMRATIQPGIRNVPAIEVQQASVTEHADYDAERGAELLLQMERDA